jgi:chromate transporter
MFLSLANLFGRLFLVSLLTFGGGMAMIPLFDQIVASEGFITSTELYNFIGISELLPGAFAVDFSVFVGNNVLYLVGGLIGFIAISLPSFTISLIIISKTNKLIEHPAVDGITKTIKPAVAGLILGVGLFMLLQFIIPVMDDGHNFIAPNGINFYAMGIFALIITLGLTVKKMGPLLLIALSGTLYLLYYIFIGRI